VDIRERTPEEQEKAYHDKGFVKFFWGGKSIGKTGGNIHYQGRANARPLV